MLYYLAFNIIVHILYTEILAIRILKEVKHKQNYPQAVSTPLMDL